MSWLLIRPNVPVWIHQNRKASLYYFVHFWLRRWTPNWGAGICWPRLSMLDAIHEIRTGIGRCKWVSSLFFSHQNTTDTHTHTNKVDAAMAKMRGSFCASARPTIHIEVNSALESDLLTRRNAFCSIAIAMFGQQKTERTQRRTTCAERIFAGPFLVARAKKNNKYLSWTRPALEHVREQLDNSRFWLEVQMNTAQIERIIFQFWV